MLGQGDCLFCGTDYSQNFLVICLLLSVSLFLGVFYFFNLGFFRHLYIHAMGKK